MRMGHREEVQEVITQGISDVTRTIHEDIAHVLTRCRTSHRNVVYPRTSYFIPFKQFTIIYIYIAHTQTMREFGDVAEIVERSMTDGLSRVQSVEAIIATLYFLGYSGIQGQTAHALVLLHPQRSTPPSL